MDKPRGTIPSVGAVTLGANAVFLSAVLLASWLALANIEREVREHTGASLQSLLETSHGSLLIWARTHRAHVDELSRERDVLRLSRALLEVPHDPEHLLASPSQTEIRTLFRDRAAHHEHEGFYVIAPDGMTVAASRDAYVGTRNLVAEQRPRVFARVLAGESVLVPPVRSDVPLVDADGLRRGDAPTMFVAAPLIDSLGRVIGVLSLRLDPHRDFSRLTQLARFGESGETYAIDREGRAITTLRFEERLRAPGLLADHESSILGVRVADPGVVLQDEPAWERPAGELPLTRAAASATALRRGIDLSGYRDYSGARVLGAWRWSPELGIGLVSEVDEDEALSPYRSTRSWIVAVVCGAAALMVFLSWLIFWVRTAGTRALAEREARLRSILDTTIDGIVTIDARGRIETFNAAAQAMFGYDASEVMGQEVSILMPEPFASQHADFVGHYLRTGEKRVIGVGREVEGRRKDGTTFPLELGVAEVPAQGDEGPRFTGMIRDLTERKALEAKFLQSQKLDAVGQLAAGVAHDFNNLLMGVGGSAKVALKHLDDRERMRELLEDICGSAVTGTAITRQLLTMTRAKHGRAREVQLDAAVIRSRGVLERLIGEDVELVVELDAPDAWVRCGDGHLEQLLMNLAVNARDAMPGGGVLTIRTGERAPVGARGGSQRYLALEVQDTGTGMDERTREHIFEPFFTTKDVGKGTGLGLSTVYGIVQQAGGWVEVDSALGRGTTFRLFLPRAEAPGRPEAEDAADRATLPPMTVLVVEDEALVRDTVAHYLRASGHRVLSASGREDAARVCAEHDGPIDALITDTVLRGEPGGVVAADVRARDPNVVVVFMSAHPEEYLWETGRLDRGTAVLPKPFEKEELDEWLRLAVEARGAAASAPEEPGPRTVLLVEDQETTRGVTKELLEDEGFVVLAAKDGAEAERLYASATGDVVLVTDLGLPDVPGGQLVEQLAAHRPIRRVVYVSGRDAEDPQVTELLERPEATFLQKPIDFDELARIVRRPF